jgi:hypothetical protein
MLFCVYATCALLLCVIGADIYRGAADTMQQGYNQRTSVLYVTEKIRKNDSEGATRIDSVNGTDALVLTEQLGDRNFETWLFVQDNTLYEGVFEQGVEPKVELCQPIMPMNSLTARMGGGTQAGETDGSLISLSFSMTDGKTADVSLWLRSLRGEFSS